METKWYVIRAVTGKEKKAVEQLKFHIEELGFADRVYQIVIPTERVFHVRNGKKVASERNYYPGYILIEIDPTIIGELSGLNKIVNFVIGFLGDKTPIALKKEEVKRILGKMDEFLMADEKILDKFNVGEVVKITDGPFNGFIGNVQEFSDERKRLKLEVKVFGRSTPLELGYTQVEKSY